MVRASAVRRSRATPSHTVLLAAAFVGALSLPAFAQPGPADEASPTTPDSTADAAASPTGPTTTSEADASPARLRRSSALLPDTATEACVAATIRCEATSTKEGVESDAAEWARRMIPYARELRGCLDGLDARTDAARINLRWEPEAAEPTIELASPGREDAPCIVELSTRLRALANDALASLTCDYECERPAPVAPGAAAPIDYVPPDVTSSRRVSWYGWQTLIADVASFGVLGGGLLSWTVEPTAIGYAGFLLATPIIHGAHHESGRAFGSFALRLLVPALGGGAGVGGTLLSNEDPSEVDIATAGGVGMAIGAGICVLLDAAALSWKTHEDSAAASLTRPTRIQPMLAVGRLSFIGLGGTF